MQASDVLRRHTSIRRQLSIGLLCPGVICGFLPAFAAFPACFGRAQLNGTLASVFVFLMARFFIIRRLLRKQGMVPGSVAELHARPALSAGAGAQLRPAEFGVARASSPGREARVDGSRERRRVHMLGWAMSGPCARWTPVCPPRGPAGLAISKPRRRHSNTPAHALGHHVPVIRTRVWARRQSPAPAVCTPVPRPDACPLPPAR